MFFLDVENFKSALTPFYTTDSLQILLCTLTTTDRKHNNMESVNKLTVFLTEPVHPRFPPLSQ